MAGFPQILERPVLSREVVKQPDDVSLLLFVGGKSVVLDAACVDTFTSCSLGRSALNPSLTADGAD